jgi:hypothetical protein
MQVGTKLQMAVLKNNTIEGPFSKGSVWFRVPEASAQ